MELDRAAVERVLRKAGELEQRPNSADRVSEAAVLEAAAEVGLDPAAVRVALAVERLGPQPAAHRGDAILGPAEVVHERVLEVGFEDALARLDDLLVREHQLRPSRSRGLSREWRRRKGAVGSVQRAARSLVGDARLSKVQRVEAVASPVDDGHTVLRVLVDRSKERSGMAVGGSVVGGMILTGTVVTGVLFSPLLLAATPLAAVAGAGVALVGRRQAHELGDAVDELLDGVDCGATPVTITEGLRATMRQLRPPKQQKPAPPTG